MLKSKNQGVVFGVLTFVFGGIIILFIFNYKSVIDFIYGIFLFALVLKYICKLCIKWLYYLYSIFFLRRFFYVYRYTLSLK